MDLATLDDFVTPKWQFKCWLGTFGWGVWKFHLFRLGHTVGRRNSSGGGSRPAAHDGPAGEPCRWRLKPSQRRNLGSNGLFTFLRSKDPGAVTISHPRSRIPAIFG